MATWIEKIKLIKGLTDRRIAHVGPFYVTLDVTRQCNLACPGCRYHSSKWSPAVLDHQSVLHMPWQLFSNLCDELNLMGTASMTISGEGEPFLHPRILDMIGKAKAVGLSVSVFTNGTLLNEENIHALIDSELDLLKVSLWASSREEYEKMYPGTDPECFDGVVASLKLLARLKFERGSAFPRVKLHQPVDRHNFRFIESMPELAEKTGCDILSFSPFKTQRRMFSSHLLTSEEEQKLREHLLRLKIKLKSLCMAHTIDTALLRYRIGGPVWKKLPCYIGWLHARIKPNGHILPCNNYEVPLGDLNEKGLQELWNGKGFQDFRRHTMTRAGLAKVATEYDCFFCCHVADNVRVHRIYRWFTPFFENRSSN